MRRAASGALAGVAALASIVALVWWTAPTGGPAFAPVAAVPPHLPDPEHGSAQVLSRPVPASQAIEAVQPAAPPRPGRERLREAVANGVPQGRIALLVDGLDDAEVAAAFESGTRMGLRWMQEHGIDASARRRLASLWVSTTASPLAASLEDAIVFRGQDQQAGKDAALSSQDRQIFAGHVLPAGYRPDAVIVRWVDLDSRSVVSLDRHPVGSGDAQEIWMRASQDWKPGRYRVEIFAADQSLQPLAGATLHLQDRISP